MVKVRLWGEGAEIEELIERICNDFTGVRVLSVSGHYKDRGASVYVRCYMDIVINPKPKIHKETAKELLQILFDEAMQYGKSTDGIKHMAQKYGIEVTQ